MFFPAYSSPEKTPNSSPTIYFLTFTSINSIYFITHNVQSFVIPTVLQRIYKELKVQSLSPTCPYNNPLSHHSTWFSLSLVTTTTHAHTLTQFSRSLLLHAMASISPPTPRNLNFSIPKFPSRIPFYPSPSHSFSLCGCRYHHHNSFSNNSMGWRWDSALYDVVSTTLKRFDSYFNSTKKEPRVVRTAT
jgi:hypothetical protein